MSGIDTLLDEAVGAQPDVSPVAEREEAADEPSMDVATPGEPVGSSGGASNGPVNVPPAASPFGTQVDPNVFDPRIHVVNEDGSPRKNKDGSYTKKRGRKAGQSYAQNAQQSAQVLDSDSVKLQKAHAAATIAVQSLFMLGRVIGGDEFLPIVDEATGVNEPAMLTQAYTQFFMTQDDINMPPWIGVAIVTGAYFINRIQLPNTKSRLSQFWGWITSFFVSAESDSKP